MGAHVTFVMPVIDKLMETQKGKNVQKLQGYILICYLGSDTGPSPAACLFFCLSDRVGLAGKQREGHYSRE